MPTLNWAGKDKVINHHLDVPMRVLECVYAFAPSGSAGILPADSGAGSPRPQDPYLLGVADGTAYYFCYEPGRAVALNRALLRKLKTKEESYVIYADTCLIAPAELNKMNIVFKKIPRDIAML